MQFRDNPRCLFTALQIVEDRKKAQAGKKFAKKAGFFSSCQDFGKGWTNASTISRFWMDSEAKTKKLEERAKALWLFCVRCLQARNQGTSLSIDSEQEKRDSLEQIAQWRNRKKTEGKNTDEQD